MDAPGCVPSSKGCIGGLCPCHCCACLTRPAPDHACLLATDTGGGHPCSLLHQPHLILLVGEQREVRPAGLVASGTKAPSVACDGCSGPHSCQPGRMHRAGQHRLCACARTRHTRTHTAHAPRVGGADDHIARRLLLLIQDGAVGHMDLPLQHPRRAAAARAARAPARACGGVFGCVCAVWYRGRRGLRAAGGQGHRRHHAPCRCTGSTHRFGS